MLRSIIGVILGVTVGSITVAIVEAIGHLVYPPPPDLDATNPEAIKAIKAFIATAPVGVLLVVLLAWAAGAFLGGLVAAWIGRRAPAVHALIVGAVILLFGIATMLMIPHPVWFWIAGILVIPCAAYVASLLARGRAAAGS